MAEYVQHNGDENRHHEQYECVGGRERSADDCESALPLTDNQEEKAVNRAGAAASDPPKVVGRWRLQIVQTTKVCQMLAGKPVSNVHRALGLHRSAPNLIATDSAGSAEGVVGELPRISRGRQNRAVLDMYGVDIQFTTVAMVLDERGVP
jgi:hypothetical protein